MSKRNFGVIPLRDRGAYFTPPEPIEALTPFLWDCEAFAEPMCGDGAIIAVLQARGWECRWASDLVPEVPGALSLDVLKLDPAHVKGCTHIISNPPWPLPGTKREGNPPGWPTTAIIERCASILPTWFLLSSDFAHNRYAVEPLRYCRQIVSVGRVSWMHNGKKGFDNAAWYLFVKPAVRGRPEFWANERREIAWSPDISEIL